MRWIDNFHKWTQLDYKQLNALVKVRESWQNYLTEMRSLP